MNSVRASVGEALRAGCKTARAAWYRATHLAQPSWLCPICGYRGPFMTVSPPTGARLHAECPCCGGRERHRLQFLVMQELLRRPDASGWRMLHVAPEGFFTAYLSARVATYETADLHAPGVDHRVDITDMPFASGHYDLVYASHVLEHVRDDAKAIAEIRRVLRPGGVAVLPVPIVAPATIEYPEPNPHEEMHVRAPGEDYFERYARCFDNVVLRRSHSFDPKYQCHVYEDRRDRPTARSPLLPSMPGDRHEDIVPVCFVSDPSKTT